MGRSGCRVCVCVISAGLAFILWGEGVKEKQTNKIGALRAGFDGVDLGSLFGVATGARRRSVTVFVTHSQRGG